MSKICVRSKSCVRTRTLRKLTVAVSSARNTSGRASIVAFIAAKFSSEYNQIPSMIPLTRVYKWSKNSKDLGSSTFTVSLSHVEMVSWRSAGVSGSDMCERAVLRDWNGVDKTKGKW